MPGRKRKVWCQQWEESERGWGQRPDGYSLHLTEKQAETYSKNKTGDAHKRYVEAGGTGVPEVYWRPCGQPYEVGVDKETYDKVSEACQSRRMPGLREYDSAPDGGGPGTWRVKK